MAKLLSRAEVFDVRSWQDETKGYTVVIADEPAFNTCTCPAFFYRKRERGESCKHISEASHSAEARTSRWEPYVSDVAELFATALTWVGGDTDRAKGLVVAYLKGRDGEPL